MSKQQTLREQLRELIERQSSVNRVALDMRIDTSRLYRFFNGERGIHWDTLEQICSHCQITFCAADESANGAPSPPPPA